MMNPMNIYYYNHREETVPIRHVLQAIGVAFRDLPAGGMRQPLNADCLIIHSPQAYEAIMEGTTVPQCMGKGGVLLFASSDGLDAEPRELSDAALGTRCFAFGIRRRPSRNEMGETVFLREGDWKEMLSAVIDAKDCPSANRLQELVTPNVRRLLWPPDETVCLSALAVLCEGYLAAHVQSTEQAVELESDVKTALQVMAWESFVREQRDPTRSSLTTNLPRVQNPDWWWRVFVEESDQHNARKEDALVLITRKFRLAFKSVPNDLSALVALIRSESVNSPATVARAYCCLAKQLEARS
jgi:hypothetical protein